MHREEAQLVLDDICHGLRVRRRAGAAAPDCVMHPRELVRHSVGDVGAGSCSRIGTCGGKM